MARIFKCDRCGEIDENVEDDYQGRGSLFYPGGIMYFCERCIEEVTNFAKSGQKQVV